MSEQKKYNVLATFDKLAFEARLARQKLALDISEIDAEIKKARYCIAELIAADVEYDKAKQAWVDDPILGSWYRIENSLARRAAAIAAVKGE